MLRKTFMAGIILIMVFLLVACGNKYNATIYSDTKALFNEDFLKENLTRSSHYFNDKGEITASADQSYPKFLTFIVTTQEEYDSKFIEFPPMVDFEKEMLLIYIFTAIKPNAYEIKKISLNNETLKIDFIAKRSGGFKFRNDTTIPMQKWLIIKIKKMEIMSVEFNKL